MIIEYIKVHTVHIPFTFSINDDLKNKSPSESIVVSVHTLSGKIGYGESNYIAEKSRKKVITNLKQIFNQYPVNELITLEDIKDVCGWLNQKHQLPAMATAFELALLDLLRQERGYSIAKFLSAKNYPIRQVVALPYLPVEQLEDCLQVVKKTSLKCIKIPLGYTDDIKRLTKARQVLGSGADIQVNVQQAWSFHEAPRKIDNLRAFNISHIEEPLLASQADKLPDLSTKIDIPLILGKSINTLRRAVYFSQKIAADKFLFNLNISKSGGLFRTAVIHRLAQSRGIQCQLAGTLGETAILHAARRLFAQTHPLYALENSLPSFFRKDDISQMPFSPTQKDIANEGFGITVAPQKLAKYTTDETIIYIQNKKQI